MRFHLSRDLHTLREKPQRDSCIVWSKLILNVIMILTSVILLIYPLILIFRVTTNEQWLFWEGISYAIAHVVVVLFEVFAFLLNLVHIHLSVIGYSILAYVSLSLCIINTLMWIGSIIYIFVIEPSGNYGFIIPEEFAYFGICPTVGYLIIFFCAAPISLLELMRESISGRFDGSVVDAKDEAEKWEKFRIEDKERIVTPRDSEHDRVISIEVEPAKVDSIRPTKTRIQSVDSQQDASLAVTSIQEDDLSEQEGTTTDIIPEEPNIVTVRPSSKMEGSPLVHRIDDDSLADLVSPITPIPINQSILNTPEREKISTRSNVTEDDEEYELVDDEQDDDDKPVFVSIRSYNYSPPPDNQEPISPRFNNISNISVPLIGPTSATSSVPPSARSMPEDVSKTAHSNNVNKLPERTRQSLPLMLALHHSPLHNEASNNEAYNKRRHSHKSLQNQHDTHSENQHLNDRLLALEAAYRESNLQKQDKIVSAPNSEISPYTTPRSEQQVVEDIVDHDDVVSNNESLSQNDQPEHDGLSDDENIRVDELNSSVRPTPLSPEIELTKSEIEAARRKKEQLHLLFENYKKKLRRDPAKNLSLED